MSIYIWLLGTSILFTAFGFAWGRSYTITRTVIDTIDSLIEDGYLKTRGSGTEIILVPWREWNSK